MPENNGPPANRNRRGGGFTKLGLLGLVILLMAFGYWWLGDLLSLDHLAEREVALRALQIDYPLIVAGAALGIYVLVAGLSLPGAAVLTLVLGWYFGFWRGLILVSFGSTAGATVAFLLSRYLFRDWVQHRMRSRLAGINDALSREGSFYLFSLRLIPAVPFFVINAVMGLTTIRVWTFWWVSQLGMLPGTAAYVYAGSTVPSLTVLSQTGARGIISWQLLTGFAILGLLPLVIKRAFAHFAPQKQALVSEAGTDREPQDRVVSPSPTTANSEAPTIR